MANLASTKKRIRQNERNRARNRKRKSEIKTGTRTLLEAIRAGDAPKAQTLLQKVSRRIDQATAKRTVHRNTAARRKSRLARRVNALKAQAPGA